MKEETWAPQNEKEKLQELGRNKIKQLKLSNDAIWAREKEREEVQAPPIIKVPYLVLCVALDVLFDKQPIAR
jgi:hypothetical protein